MIKVSFEVPLTLLPNSLSFNDYDYALLHLIEKYPSYLTFYKKSLSNGRTVILDNGVQESREPYDVIKFISWLSILKPTEYIVPDCIDNKEKTIELFKEFGKRNEEGGIRIGVVQGNSTKDLLDCYSFMNEHADKIGISFDYEFWKDGPHKTKWLNLEYNRQQFIYLLTQLNLVNYSKPHHLLGCAVPQEFLWYSNNPSLYSFLESLDTSNPTICSYLNIKYDREGLLFKPPLSIIDIFNARSTHINLELLKYNVTFFLRHFLRSPSSFKSF